MKSQCSFILNNCAIVIPTRSPSCTISGYLPGSQRNRKWVDLGHFFRGDVFCNKKKIRKMKKTFISHFRKMGCCYPMSSSPVIYISSMLRYPVSKTVFSNSKRDLKCISRLYPNFYLSPFLSMSPHYVFLLCYCRLQ